MPVHRSWPWARPVFGLPYHGLVDNEVLTLSNGERKEIAFTGHQTVLVRGRNARKPVFTAEEKAWHTRRGYRWQDYALLSGYYREIGGVQLGAQSWLYCDAHYTWIIDLELAASDLELIGRVYLRDLFGALAVDAAPPSMDDRRLLAEWHWQPQSYTGNLQGSTQAGFNRYAFLTHAQHGERTAVNIACSLDESGVSSFFGSGFGYMYGGNGYVVHDVFQVDILGNGSITDGSVGNGIRASVTHLADCPGLRVSSTRTRYYAAVSKEGNVVWLDSDTTSTVTVDEERDGDEFTYTLDETTTTELTTTVTFGSVSCYARRTSTVHKYWDVRSGIFYVRDDVTNNPSAIQLCAAVGTPGALNCAAYFSSVWTCGVNVGSALVMIAPDVFRVSTRLYCANNAEQDLTAYRVISANGDTLSTYDDATGITARLISYNPDSGEFSLAATGDDLVQWV